MLQASVDVIKEVYFPEEALGQPGPWQRQLVSSMGDLEPCICTLTLYQARGPGLLQSMSLRRPHVLLLQANIVAGDVICFTVFKNERIQVCPLSQQQKSFGLRPDGVAWLVTLGWKNILLLGSAIHASHSHRGHQQHV